MASECGSGINLPARTELPNERIKQRETNSPMNLNYFFEHTMPIYLVGLVLITFFGVAFHSTRKTGAFVGLVIVIALTVSALVMVQLVETPREGVIKTLRATTTALESNEVDRVLSFLADDAAKLRQLVEVNMKSFTVDSAQIYSDVEVELDDEKNPKHASATMQVVVSATHKSSGQKGYSKPTRVVVELRRLEKRWVIESCPQAGDIAKLR